MTAIKLFGDKKVRSVWDEENKIWLFVVADAVAILTESSDPKDYIKKMRLRDPELGQAWDTLCTTRLMETEKSGVRSQYCSLKIIPAIMCSSQHRSISWHEPRQCWGQGRGSAIT